VRLEPFSARRKADWIVVWKHWRVTLGEGRRGFGDEFVDGVRERQTVLPETRPEHLLQEPRQDRGVEGVVESVGL